MLMLAAVNVWMIDKHRVWPDHSYSNEEMDAPITAALTLPTYVPTID